MAEEISRQNGFQTKVVKAVVIVKDFTDVKPLVLQEDNRRVLPQDKPIETGAGVVHRSNITSQASSTNGNTVSIIHTVLVLRA